MIGQVSMIRSSLIAWLGLSSAKAIATVAGTDRVVLITRYPPSSDLAGCLRTAYYGAFGGRADEHIFIPSPNCLDENDLALTLQDGHLGALQNVDDGYVVWIGPAGVEGQVQDVEADWAVIKSRAQTFISPTSRTFTDQSVFGLTHTSPISLVLATSSSLLVHVPLSFLPILDTLLPSHLVPVVLPSAPLQSAVAGWEAVPDHYARHLANITSHVKFDPELDRVLADGIGLDGIRRDIRWLTGEAPSGIESRHSFTKGAVKAAHWIKDKVEATGAECALFPFLPGFSPDVICTYPSLLKSSEHVILSAHYDSRGSFGSTRAPGGDDDASGSAHLIGIAQAVKQMGIKFDKKVVFAFFAGEEQGLLGSNAYAAHLKEENATVLLQIQADMLGYHAPGEPMQLGLPESIHLPQASYLLGNLSSLYSPELLIGKTPACCSDHQSFLSLGFPSTAVFERNGNIVDPMYHNSGDLSQRDGYDFEQIVSIAKVTMAAVLTVAGWRME